ncbi:MAG TPA: TIGR00303 family protein [Archaeoglobus profundus]|nr:TIGR00303 family protein [Archaeoglobus profundus]
MDWKCINGGERYFELLKGNVAFVLVIGNTKTAEIPGITIAGAKPELIKYTPPADAELLYHGECKVIPHPPATPDGKPTPAIITYTSLRLTGVPIFVVDSGLMVKPHIPFISIDAPVGENIDVKQAMDIRQVKKAFNNAFLLGKQLSKLVDAILIGESIPAGTTTALAVLRAMGIKYMVSSSMPKNPIKLKEKVVSNALKRIKGDEEPLEIIAKVGDPVMVGICGIAVGSEKPVILAGGTQMVAVAYLISKLSPNVDMCIVTTRYVAEDVNLTAPCPIIVVDPGLDMSSKPGLKAYADGFVKEGVGAGGATLLAYARGFSKNEFLKEIEKSYYEIIESKL